MADLQWTTKPPTIDGQGWYWATSLGGLLRIVEVEQWDDGKLHVWPDGKTVAECGYTYWIGPLPEPEPPRAQPIVSLTIDADLTPEEIEEFGRITRALFEAIEPGAGERATMTILAPIVREWDTPEEDEAWKTLQ